MGWKVKINFLVDKAAEGRENLTAWFKSLFHTVKDKETINRTVNHLKSKGDQRLTIMIIPHGEQKIFNFQLSLAMVVFAFFLFALLFTISILGIVETGNDEDEVVRLSQIDYQNLNEIENFEKARHKIEALEREINVNHNRLLQIIESNEEEGDYKPLKYLSELSRAQLTEDEKKEKTDFIDAVYEFRFLHNRLERELYALRTISGFVTKRTEIARNTPYAWPVYGRISSGYGLRQSPTAPGRFEHHPGIDIAARYGLPIYAPADGLIQKAILNRGRTGYGTHVVIKHRYGFSTLFGHCDQLFVKTGDRVKKGQKIATVGNTGRSTGPHLHYEVRFGDQAVQTNPNQYLPGL